MTGPGQQQSDNDAPFRRLLIVATGLALAVMAISVASIRPGSAGLQFEWRWPALLWGAAAAVCAWPFWRLVWAVQENPSPRNKRRLTLFCGLMLALGLAGFLYPLRFTAPSYRWDLVIGLVVALVVLAAVAVMLYGLARAFARADSDSPPRQ